MRRLALLLPLLALALAGCPKPAAPPAQPMRPPITDSRPAGSQAGDFLKKPTRPGSTSTSKNTGGANTSKAVAGASADDPLGVFGNPDGADESTQDRYLIHHPSFTLSYNDSLHFPNWVAWHLVESDIRTEDRGNFVPDPELPNGFTRITTRDYSGTGYDRGHNCPSKDRSPVTDARGTVDYVFFMSNITPQTHDMNAGPWEKLEIYSRELAKEGKTLNIICGHGFKGDPSKAERIGPKQIPVPDFAWKIIVVTEPGESVGEQSRVIAVKMDNIKGIASEPWDNYITTVAEIESATGLHFFAGLPESVAQALKQKRDEGAGSFTSAESGFRKSKRRSKSSSFGGSSSGVSGGRR